MATAKVSHLSLCCYTTAPSHGVITVYGYGVGARVERGHLLLDFGLGSERRRFRLPRVGHGLKRLVIIGSDGMISLAALRWMSDQNVSLAMLERNGKVLAVTGPVRSSDAKLRRAQALAFGSDLGLKIARELITRKLVGQEKVVRELLRDSKAADEIATFHAALPKADRLHLVRTIESQAAAVYWGTFRDVPITFPTKDLARVPEHWRTFGTRKSLITGSPRLAVNPPNAMLNYLYSVLESESRLATAALGLDPGLGVLHLDTPARDSLACDVMEAIRPQVDQYVLRWILSLPLRRESFFEQRNGNCRLMAPFAIRLTETAPVWARAIAPIAEWVVRQLWSTAQKRTHSDLPPTRLTQDHRRKAKGITAAVTRPRPAQPQNVCRGCGKRIKDGRIHCSDCAVATATQRLVDAARFGRVAAQTPDARKKHAESERRHALARSSWDPASQPTWLTKELFSEKIQPLLANVSTSSIRSQIGVSQWYASRIRKGYRPHPRHWQTLLELVRIQL
jgi:CRISPR-associated endonuclease Cas1